jgi:hypothetical protein
MIPMVQSIRLVMHLRTVVLALILRSLLAEHAVFHVAFLAGKDGARRYYPAIANTNKE